MDDCSAAVDFLANEKVITNVTALVLVRSLSSTIIRISVDIIRISVVIIWISVVIRLFSIIWLQFSKGYKYFLLRLLRLFGWLYQGVVRLCSVLKTFLLNRCFVLEIIVTS